MFIKMTIEKRQQQNELNYIIFFQKSLKFFLKFKEIILKSALKSSKSSFIEFESKNDNAQSS